MKCPYCGSKYIGRLDNYSLQEKLYVCYQCGKVFKEVSEE